MVKFEMRKSKSANIYKSIRFPVEIDTKITELVEEANKGKIKKEYSFNGFVISACEYALNNLNK